MPVGGGKNKHRCKGMDKERHDLPQTMLQHKGKCN